MLRWYARVGERQGWYAGDNSFWPLSLKPPLNNPKFLLNNPPPLDRLKVRSGNIVVEDYRQQGTSYLYKYSASADVSADVAVFYFPGWELRIDGQSRNNDLSMEENGLVRVKLPAGVHMAELEYGLSPIGRIARGISFVAWIIWGLLAILALPRRRSWFPVSLFRRKSKISVD
jgi:hypothetical protein